jgi:hypothetical protein
MQPECRVKMAKPAQPKVVHRGRTFKVEIINKPGKKNAEKL